MRSIKKRILLTVLLVLSTVLVAPVSALETETHLWLSCSGRVFVTLPDHPPLMIEPLDVKFSTYTVPHDSLIIYTHVEGIGYVPWIGVADDAKCVELMNVMFGPIGFSATKVDEEDLQISSCLTRVTIDLKVTVNGIHPFKIVVDRSIGRGELTRVTDMQTPGGPVISWWGKAYEATATVTGPDGELPADEAIVYNPNIMVIRNIPTQEP